MKKNARVLKSSFIAIAASLVPAGVHAQASAPASEETSQAADDGALGEIVVTAQKRSENLQNVPISITALSGEDLASRQVVDLRELVVGAPNVQASGAFGDSVPIFSVRGITTVTYSPVDSTPVATYYDEVYKGSVVLLGVGMYDLERVEVLKGPQGTLYGRSTTGGAVNLVSRKPEFETQGNIRLSYGRFDRVTAEGAAEVALSDTLGGRIAFLYDHDKGFVKNLFPGSGNANQTNRWGVRASLRFKPSDAIDFVLRYSHSDQDYRAFGVVVIPTDPNNEFAMGRVGLGRRDINTPDFFNNIQKGDSVSLNGTIALSDTLSLTSITSWDHSRIFWPTDVDGLSQDYGTGIQVARQTMFAQDTRISSDFDGPFNFIVGGYYGRDRSSLANSFGAFQEFFDANGNGDFVDDCLDSILNSIGELCSITGSFDQLKTSLAGYTDFSYKLADALTFRGGLRYTYDKGHLTNYQVFLGTPISVASPTGTEVFNIITGTPGGSLDSKFHHGRWSYKLGIDYKTPGGTLLYASYNVGYRAASFNNLSFQVTDATIAASKPEKLTSTELGFKSEMFDRRVRLNGSIFWYRFTDQQVFFQINPGSNELFNLDKSRVLGAELEMQAKITERLTLNASMGLLDSKVTKSTVPGFNIAGNELVQAPKFNASVGFDYALPLGQWGAADLHADYYHSASQYFDILNSPLLKAQSFDLVNARLRIHPDGDRYGVSLWVKNLTNEYYTTFRAPGYGFILTNVNPPRTFGVSVDAKF